MVTGTRDRFETVSATFPTRNRWAARCQSWPCAPITIASYPFGTLHDLPGRVARDDDSVHLPPALVGYLASALEHRPARSALASSKSSSRTSPIASPSSSREPDDVQDRHVRVGMIVECVLQRLRRVVGVVHRNEDIGEQLCRRAGSHLSPAPVGPGRPTGGDPW